VGRPPLGPGRGVTAHASTALRSLALQALALRAGSAAGAQELAAAAQGLYDDLAGVSAPLIGQVGINALTGRALFLVQRSFPWMMRSSETGAWTGPFAQIAFCLEQQDPAVATEAAGAVFATLTGLLANFIGEPLTMRVLQKAWPDVFTDANAEEM